MSANDRAFKQVASRWNLDNSRLRVMSKNVHADDIYFPMRDYDIIVAWAFAYYSAKAVQTPPKKSRHNEVISL